MDFFYLPLKFEWDVIDDDFQLYIHKNILFFSIYTIYTFSNKNLQSPGTYISKLTWDPSQKAITK